MRKKFLRKKDSGKKALITGGARGLGRLIALDLAKRGADVCIVDIREKDMEETSAEVEALGVKCLCLAVDLSTKTACYKMVARAKKNMGGLDILVNNAGVVWNRDFMDLDDDMIQKTVQVNLMAQIWGSRAALPDMVSQGSGTIVSISSGTAFTGVPAMSVYCGTKHALRGFFDSLRHELRMERTGVNVIVVYPGYMDTKMFTGAKIPRLTSRFSAQKVSDGLMRAMDKGKETVVVPKSLYAMDASRLMLAPWYAEKVIELTGMHKSFYGSKTVD